MKAQNAALLGVGGFGRLPADLEPKDGVITNTWVSFGWQDRLRVLFGRRVHVRVVTRTEFEVGRTAPSTADVFVERVFPRKLLATTGEPA